MINNRQNGRRRGRGGGGPQVRGPNNGNDRGNRIDNRARGNAAQLHEKYKNLARDAQTQGDRVMTEYYHQFADHYFRVLSESRSRFDEQNPNQQRRPRYDNEDYDGDGMDYAEGGDEGSEPEAREPQQEQPQYRRDRNDRDDRGNQERGNQDRAYAQDRPGGQERTNQGRSNQDRSYQERGNRDERGPYRQRTDHREPIEAVATEQAPAAAAPEQLVEAPRPRRGRPPKKVETQVDDASPKIEVDRLPPSFSVASEASSESPAEGEEQAPRRRRARRVASSEDNVAA